MSEDEVVVTKEKKSFVKEFFEVDAELASLLYFAEEESPSEERSNEVEYLLHERMKNRDEFLRQVGNWRIQKEAQLAAYEAENKPVLEAIQRNIKAYKNGIKNTERLIRLVLSEDEECIGNEISCWYQAPTTAVEVDDEELVPRQFKKAVWVVLKDRIKDTGKDCDGARIVQNRKLVVEPGGESAIRRATNRKKPKKNERTKKNLGK